MSNLFDVVIVHGPSDNETLPYCVNKIKENVEHFRNIYIISWNPLDDIFLDKTFIDCKVIDENSFPITKKDVNQINQTPSRDGWYLQQLIKLYCSFFIEEMLDDYLVIDSDTLFLKKTEFKSGTRYMFNLGDEYWVPYFEHMYRLHPSFVKLTKFSGISHHMIFNRHLVKEMMTLAEQHCNNVFWKAFLLNVDPERRNHSGASEYEMYFNFMLQYHKDKVLPRKLRFINTGESIQSALHNLQNSDVSYVSIHAYMANRQTKQKEVTKVLNGENLQMLCDVTILTQEINNFHRSLPQYVKRVYLDNITPSDIEFLNTCSSMFVYTHSLERFKTEIMPLLKNRIILMTHNSDHTVNESHLDILNDEKILHMFSQNTFIDHPKLTSLPIGIANSMWPHGQKESINYLINLPTTKKVDKVYVNINVGTNVSHRAIVMNSLNMIRDICHFSPPNKQHNIYLEEMSKFKWVASPKGNGVDCHRLWEAMYAGCIALVDDSVNARSFKAMGLPIILIGTKEGRTWGEMSIEWLEEQSKDLVPIHYKHNVLNLDWWKSKMESYLPVNEGAFILVYIGYLREFTYECVKQIRMWNPTEDIYLCINNNDHNKPYVENLKVYNVKVKYIEELDMTLDHKKFNQNYINLGMNGFWKYTMERFFIVEECMRKCKLENIIHLEMDNMIYFSINEILNVCKSINKILIPSDSEFRYIAGTCFINNPESVSQLNHYFATQCTHQDEMHSIMKFYRSSQTVLDTWPVLPDGDTTHLIYQERSNMKEDIARLSKYGNIFHSVADAAAVGQYFGGIDPIHNRNNTDGFVNKDSIFSVDRLWFKWTLVNNLQRLNMSMDKETWIPITNLHIHNKNLKRWLSDIPEMTKHLANIL